MIHLAAMALVVMEVTATAVVVVKAMVMLVTVTGKILFHQEVRGVCQALEDLEYQAMVAVPLLVVDTSTIS